MAVLRPSFFEALQPAARSRKRQPTHRPCSFRGPSPFAVAFALRPSPFVPFGEHMAAAAAAAAAVGSGNGSGIALWAGPVGCGLWHMGVHGTPSWKWEDTGVLQACASRAPTRRARVSPPHAGVGGPWTSRSETPHRTSHIVMCGY
jgi:hypothetical protein